MSAQVLGPALPWTSNPADERRYANTLLAVCIPLLLIAIAMPLLPRFQHLRPIEQPVPERLVKLVIEQRKQPPPPKPKPKPKPKPVKQKKPQEKPVPKAEPQPTPKPKQTKKAARKKADKSGVLAFADQLKDLRDNSAAAAVSSQRKLSKADNKATSSSRKLITSQFGKGATGIESRAGGAGAQLGGTTELAGHSSTRVSGPPGGGEVSGGSARHGTGSHASRSTEDIQIVFDRHKSQLFALYQRALRSDPTLQGTLVLKLVIQPSGAVSSVRVVSSEIKDPALVKKIINRIKLFDFGAKNVPVWRGSYPLRFFPSS